MADFPTTWLVGAFFGEQTEDRAAAMVEAGEWYHNFPPAHKREHQLTRAMAPGDRIVLKSAYVRKNGLPFDAGGKKIGVMKLKAAGTIRQNTGDGTRVVVDWELDFEPREWFFSAYQPTITRLRADSWKAQALYDFVFTNVPQDIPRFLANWRELHPDTFAGGGGPFAWIPFYEEFATKLLEFRYRRGELISSLSKLHEEGLPVSVVQDRHADGSVRLLEDICPFTVMGTFNRQIKDNNRTAIATRLAQKIGVTKPAPSAFASIPLVNNQSSWFFAYSSVRSVGDIDAHWALLAAAVALTSEDTPSNRATFCVAFDASQRVRGVKWNVTQALYWARPERFVPLEAQSRAYLTRHLEEAFDLPLWGTPPDGHRYLQLCDDLLTYYANSEEPPRSIPEFSLAAYNDGVPLAVEDDAATGDVAKTALVWRKAVLTDGRLTPSYTIDDIVDDGCFVTRAELQTMLDTLRTKKNVILQGPPGTGKTWLAKRLCWAHFGSEERSRIASFQFHPNLSYEDFVQGFRPGADGRLELRDGSFVDFCEHARSVGGPHAVVIEEINRGNPAQVLGELLTLLEADKRSEEHALRLCYGDRPEFFVPAEVVVVGTMNIADRSLAMVDVALRRRFAFFMLNPCFDETWRHFVVLRGVSERVAATIAIRMEAMNAFIADAPGLGKNFRIGHSYFVPQQPGVWDGTWAETVFRTEIVPLIREYFFDDSAAAEKHAALLGAPIEP